jgi:hypothetical protein
MLAGREDVGAAEKVEIGGRVVPLDAIQDLLETTYHALILLPRRRDYRARALRDSVRPSRCDLLGDRI